jgi:hypothetical protein
MVQGRRSVHELIHTCELTAPILQLAAMVDETDIANVRPSNHVDFTTETIRGGSCRE